MTSNNSASRSDLITVDRNNIVIGMRVWDEVKEGVILDFDKEGKIIALEILGVSNKLPQMSMDSINFEVKHPERIIK